MPTCVLIPGGFRLVVLASRRPDRVLDAIGERRDPIVAGQATVPVPGEMPAEFMRRMVPERLGITLDEIDGGHSSPLSRPHELAERCEAMRVETVSR